MNNFITKTTPCNIGNDGLLKQQYWANRDANNGKRVQYMEELGWNIKQPPEYHASLVLMEMEKTKFEQLKRRKEIDKKERYEEILKRKGFDPYYLLDEKNLKIRG